MTDFETQVLAALAEINDRLDGHDARFSAQETTLAHLTDLCNTLHNKVDAVRYNLESLTGTVETMRLELSGNTGAIADLRQDLQRHTHD